MEDFNKPEGAPASSPKSVLEFQMSSQTEKLIAALVKAQAEIVVAIKNSDNPHFRSPYANLASVWEACREPLSKAGVLVIQFPIPPSAPNRVALITRVAHGDQWMQSGLEIPIAQVTAQAVGSALTYLRRYMLQTVAGVAPDEDEDGNAATGSHSRSPTPKPQVAPTVQPNQQQQAVQNVKGPSSAQITRLWTIAKSQAWTNEAVHAYIEERWKIQSVTQLDRAQYEELVDNVVSKKSFEQAKVSLNWGKDGKP